MAIVFMTSPLIALISEMSYGRPMKITRNWKAVSTADRAFQYVDDSTLISMDILLLEDDGGLPEAYTTYIRTPVCDDTLCNLLHIQMYWNVLGNYLGFDTIAGESLTKNDHLAFTNEDYDKLHQLLQDDNAVIKRKSKAELFDKTETRQSEVVDAVTGATALEVKEAVVDGALYSCYTLYHLVYGEISDRIQLHTEELLDRGLTEKLLNSQYADDQLYALKNLNEDDFLRYKEIILGLIESAIPLNRIYILKKMPKILWQDREVQLKLGKYFMAMDVNSRTYVLNKLLDEDWIEPQSLNDMANCLTELSKNQVKSLSAILAKNEEVIWSSTRMRIDSIVNGGQFRYDYLLQP